MNPLVSVIIPTKNSAKFLQACLESVKKQTYSNIEIIVVDNNSTDNTKEIAGKFTDKVFNQGPERSAQRNFGVQQSRGEYVVIIDSDMELSPKVIEACVQKVVENSSIKGLIIPEESFGEGFWAQCKKLERSFYVGVDWMEAARFFEKKVYEELGGYDITMTGEEDWDFSQRVENKYKIDRVDQYIYHNEQRIDLWKSIKKKAYYVGGLKAYSTKIDNTRHSKLQTNPLARYRLFFSNPKKLFKNPVLGVGMLFMKTSEFAAGAIVYIFK